MAYWRVILKGSLGSVETWSTSVAFGIVGLAPDVPNQTLTDSMGNALKAFLISANVPADIRNMLSTSGEINAVRVELRAEDESTLSVNEQLLASTIIGGAGANKTPQDCLVFSLRTSTPGPRGRGRMYWPALTTTLSSSFQLTSPTPALAVAAAKTFLSGIGNAMNNVYIAAASALRVALAVRSVTDHTCRDVTSLQVGSILDTQRRRRDDIPESYSAVVYP